MHLVNFHAVLHMTMVALEAVAAGFVVYLVILGLWYVGQILLLKTWGSTRAAQQRYAKRYEASNGVFDLTRHLRRQIKFSSVAFGSGFRPKGIADHIRKELAEIEQDPYDLKEWVDVILLGLDGAWRSSHTPEQICKALADKLAENESREWPDWRTADPNKAIEHIKAPPGVPKDEGAFS